jgi:hypothetical protein
MNPHPPYIIHNCYWHPGPYQIWGPTDVVYPRLQPVNHIGPPPFGPRWWYQQPVMPCGGPGECCENGMCYGQPGQPGYPLPPGAPVPPGSPAAGPAGPGAQTPDAAGKPGAPNQYCPPGAAGAAAAKEGRWFRSPRDFYMYSYPY